MAGERQGGRTVMPPRAGRTDRYGFTCGRNGMRAYPLARPSRLTPTFSLSQHLPPIALQRSVQVFTAQCVLT